MQCSNGRGVNGLPSVVVDNQQLRNAESALRDWTIGSQEEVLLEHDLEQLRLDPIESVEIRRLVLEQTDDEVWPLSDEWALALRRLFAIQPRRSELSRLRLSWVRSFQRPCTPPC